MSGNLWEWCSDWYGKFSNEAQTNPKGPSSGKYRVVRGGSWYGSVKNCHVLSRSTALFGSSSAGLRLACDVE